MTAAEFTRRLQGIKMLDVAVRICNRHGASLIDVAGEAGKRNARRPHVCRAREDIIRQVAARFPEWSSTTLGEFFERDHSTILYALKRLRRHRKSLWARDAEPYVNGLLQAAGRAYAQA